MKKLNVQPSFLMNHVRFYGAAYRDQIFGPERADFMDPRRGVRESRLPHYTLTDPAPHENSSPWSAARSSRRCRCARFSWSGPIRPFLLTTQSAP